MHREFGGIHTHYRDIYGSHAFPETNGPSHILGLVVFSAQFPERSVGFIHKPVTRMDPIAFLGYLYSLCNPRDMCGFIRNFDAHMDSAHHRDLYGSFHFL